MKKNIKKFFSCILILILKSLIFILEKIVGDQRRLRSYLVISSEKAYDDNTIVLNIDGTLRKIFKVTPHGNGDGGFDVSTPYHKEKSGYLFLIRIPYEPGMTYVNLEENTTKKFVTTTDVSLSIHRSGFVQFSKSSKIISGVDKKTGKTKGIGLTGLSLLDNPIKSGPTFGVQVWGIEDFSELPKKKEKVNYIEFKDLDFIYEGCTKDDRYSYCFEVFLFPIDKLRYAYKKSGELLITKSFDNYLPSPGKVLTLKVVLINNCPSFLAILGKKMPLHEEMPKSGYMLNGPSRIIGKTEDGYNIGEMMKAYYPDPKFFKENDSIDYRG